MKKRNYCLYACFIFYIAQNCWFGWNSEPSCTAERVCDYITQVLFLIGGFNWLCDRIASEVVERLKSKL